MMMPVALPLAFEFSGGEITPLIYQTVAAIAGGGHFRRSFVAGVRYYGAFLGWRRERPYRPRRHAAAYALSMAAITAGLYAWM